MAGILNPFERDKKNDLASGEGDELLRSKVEQLIMTEGKSPYGEGELPWRTDFGSKIHVLRHDNNSDVAAELARVWIRDAFRKYLPEVELGGIEAVNDGGALYLKVTYLNSGQTNVSNNVSAVSVVLPTE